MIPGGFKVYAAFLSTLCSTLAAVTFQQVKPSIGHGPGFTLLSPQDTGITWTNSLPPHRYAERQNLMNGAGVALGDYDGDGLCDIYLCNKFGPNVLYRNLGNWRFEDVTAQSRTACTNQISTGSVFADTNGDGSLDLLVTSFLGPNVLFQNLKNGSFTNVTQSAGLGSKGGSTSQALADLDGDGDLDLYVNYFGIEALLRDGSTFSTRMVGGKPVIAGRFAKRLTLMDGKVMELGDPDQIYLNDGTGRFTPLKWEENFLDESGKPLSTPPPDFGLAVQIRDINGDGSPDIYTCNDFQTPDRLWLNDGTGKFRAASPLSLRSISYASMGVDFADLDRDGRLDFITVEMLSRDHRRHLKQSSPKLSQTRVIGDIERREDVARNALFWNRGDGTYAEIAWFAGVAASDWSWTPIFIDVDLDGFEDLLVSNGHMHDVNDRDAIAKRPPGSNPSIAERRAELMTYPRLEPPKAAFRNRGDLTFEDMRDQWGFNSTRITHGMALADLDNDGDMDLVGNCANEAPLIYRNNAQQPRIAVRLRGHGANTHAIGATIDLIHPTMTQTQEILSGGRYLSGDESARSFAAPWPGDYSIRVRWRGGRETIVDRAVVNSAYIITEEVADINKSEKFLPTKSLPIIFEDWTGQLSHSHQELVYEDFQRQPLLPKRLSQLGPALAWADLDRNGTDDLIIGAGRGGILSVLSNDGKGRFTKVTTPFPKFPDDSAGIQILESRNDSQILVAVANYELVSGHGKILSLDPKTGVSQEIWSGSHSPGPLALADIDGDGDLDLFIGARMIPGQYPLSPASTLLLNHSGRFESITNSSIASAGLISGAVFSDLDSDGFPELILASEWGPLKVLQNKKGVFSEVTSDLGLAAHTGLWTSVTTGDMDGDGALDIIAGNIGLNNFYYRAPNGPWYLYYLPLHQNQEIATLEAHLNPDLQQVVPWRDLKQVGASIPWVGSRFNTHQAYAHATAREVLADQWSTTRELRATTLASTIFWNRRGKFVPEPLPREAQWSAAFGLTVADFSGDGLPDLFMAQNFFAGRPEDDRLDAGRGLLLRGLPGGKLQPVPGQESGLLIYGEQRASAAGDFDQDGRLDLVVAQNAAPTRLFHNTVGSPGLRIRLKGPPGNPRGYGALLRSQNGKKITELRAGSGYWSQDSATVVIHQHAGDLLVRWPGGLETVAPIPPDSLEVEIAIDGTVRRVK